MTIRIALIGAGLFARDAHIPALLQLPEVFEIAAICTRTPASAEAANALLPQPVPVYHDITDLLTRSHVEAVDIALPIHLLPRGVKMALAAGKHVISEKPIAPTVNEAIDLLDFYGHHEGLVWMVAENYRYAESIQWAAEVIQQGILGQLALATWTIFAGMSPQKRYYQTEWRRDNSYPGGFLLDGGVHFMATLRMILGEVRTIKAFTNLVRADLPPLDTVTASIEFESGLLGSYAVTYAGGVPWTTNLTIVGERGVLEVARGYLRLTVDGEVVEEVKSSRDGIVEQFEAFADAILEGRPHRNTPSEAMMDLAMIEAMLLSAKSGKPISPSQVVDLGG